MSGVKTKITLPFLKHFLDSGSIVLNKAELELSPELSTSADYPPPSQLTVACDKCRGRIITFLQTTLKFQDTMEDNIIQRRINTNSILPVRLQRILDGRDENFGFYLVPSGSSIQANQSNFG